MNKKIPSEADVFEFFQALMEASHAVDMFVEKTFFAESDITMIQFGILDECIRRGGSIDTISSLCHSRHTSKGNISGIITRMMSVGLLTQQSDPVDRRKKRIHMTDAGHEKHKDITSVMKKYVPLFIQKVSHLPLSEVTTSLQTITSLHLNALK